MSNFDFVHGIWPAIAQEALRAEQYTYSDPRSSVFYARRTLELTVNWLYRADASLSAPYKDDLVSLIYEPTVTQLVGPALLTKMDLIRKQGNHAVHRTNPVTPSDSLPACPMAPATASSTTCSGAPTACRSDSSKPSAPASTRTAASSRRGSTPTRSSAGLGTGR